VSSKVKKLADNLYSALNDAEPKQVYEESDALKLSTESIALIQPMLER
jgi:hypothetical protein